MTDLSVVLRDRWARLKRHGSGSALNLLWATFCVQCLVAALDVCLFNGSIKIASTEHFSTVISYEKSHKRACVLAGNSVSANVTNV